jgi:hypothetical protein
MDNHAESCQIMIDDVVCLEDELKIITCCAAR